MSLIPADRPRYAAYPFILRGRNLRGTVPENCASGQIIQDPLRSYLFATGLSTCK
jgi:hypothetical protein